MKMNKWDYVFVIFLGVMTLFAVCLALYEILIENK